MLVVVLPIYDGSHSCDATLITQKYCDKHFLCGQALWCKSLISWLAYGWVLVGRRGRPLLPLSPTRLAKVEFCTGGECERCVRVSSSGD